MRSPRAPLVIVLVVVLVVACSRLAPRFHNAQTINLAVLLSIITLYYTWRSARDGLGVAAVAGSIYWLAGLAAILYPGTSGLDPEFGGPACPQLVPFTAFAGLAVAGWALEVAW